MSGPKFPNPMSIYNCGPYKNYLDRPPSNEETDMDADKFNTLVNYTCQMSQTSSPFWIVLDPGVDGYISSYGHHWKGNTANPLPTITIEGNTFVVELPSTMLDEAGNVQAVQFKGVLGNVISDHLTHTAKPELVNSRKIKCWVKNDSSGLAAFKGCVVWAVK